MTRMTTQSEANREEIENTLAVIGKARLLLRSQITLRVRQAAQRGNSDLLEPALAQLGDVDLALGRAQAVIGQTWRAGERAGWKVAAAK